MDTQGAVSYGLGLARAGYDRARAALRGGLPSVALPMASGGLPLVGHMLEFARNPFAMLMRARAEGGDVVELQLLNQSVVMLTGPEANEAFFRAPDDQLCRREAYKVMTPIFGKGVVFDAPVPRMNRQMQMIMPLLRDRQMRTYPAGIAAETAALTAKWGRGGVLDILAFMKELTIYTSTRCLIGEEFRGGITEEFFEIYQDLEHGVDALAYVLPNLPIPKFRRRDAARARLQQLIEGMMAKRRASGVTVQDGLQTLIDSTYEDGSKLTGHELTGLLTALILAGHHTSAGTAVWILVELLRHPTILGQVQGEIDAVMAGRPEITYAMLREMTSLGAVIKEVLRLHPPLIFLFRKVLREFRFGDYVVAPGKFVCAAPAVTHRIAEVFTDPERFDPGRYARESEDDPSAWISFGGGKHKCTGNAFGVLQLKTIIATLMSRYEFELFDTPAKYVDDYLRPTVQPKGPCLLQYRERSRAKASAPRARGAVAAAAVQATIPTSELRVTLDRHRCQGHAVCVSEAPEIFRVGDDSVVEVALDAELAATRRTGNHLTFYPAPEHNQQVVCAARYCPNHAIAIEEVSSKGPSKD